MIRLAVNQSKHSRYRKKDDGIDGPNDGWMHACTHSYIDLQTQISIVKKALKRGGYGKKNR